VYLLEGVWGKKTGRESFLVTMSTAFPPSPLRPGWLASHCLRGTKSLYSGWCIKPGISSGLRDRRCDAVDPMRE